jgi:MoxR-like ATPase
MSELAFMSPAIEAEFRAMAPARHAPPSPAELTTKLMGIEFPVNAVVPEGECLPAPRGYRLPTKGGARAAHRRVLLAVRNTRKVFVHGDPGTGKDAVFHFLSETLGLPAKIRTFSPDVDVHRWFYTREIGGDGTRWDLTRLFRAITEGHTGTDGVTRPYLVLFSDIDRATPEQLEVFRLMLDTTSMRIMGPAGDTHRIWPGTHFVFTANSCGTGDATGRMSSQAMDASMLDRMGRFVKFTYLHWADEAEILRGKFPALVEAVPSIFDELGMAATAVRKAISARTLYAELTHRGLCEILQEAEDELEAGSKSTTLLRKGMSAWLDRLDDQRLEARRLMDSAIKGGLIATLEEDEES